MDLKRFEDLCEAYGGDLRRWPLAEQAQAYSLAAHDRAAADLLSREEALDALLFHVPAPLPSAALRERILAAAPRPSRNRPSALNWLLPAGLSAGLAAAGVAGVLVGAAFSSQAVLDEPGLVVFDASPGLTAFGEVTDVLEG